MDTVDNKFDDTSNWDEEHEMFAWYDDGGHVNE